MTIVLTLIEHDRGKLAPASLDVLSEGRKLAAKLGAVLHSVTLGESADGLASDVSKFGAEVIHQVHHPLLRDYGPQAWGESVAQLAKSIGADVIMATGTDRGNEVLAQVAARMELPMVANCIELKPSAERWEVVRFRWGGSLWERSSLEAPVKILTLAPHQVEAREYAGAGVLQAFEPVLDDSSGHTIVRARVEVEQGCTLATAPVVVSGGRGVKSAEGFAPLEELASLLGGVVGCSRVATNNGWRPHSDQVGQTGTRIAPEIYIACGISGAIQHWVGAMGSKNILAINTDPEANMVNKADYAIIGDLHEVVPAIIEAVKAAKG
jgi:electron transfer flavoprotein alpha subunit